MYTNSILERADQKPKLRRPKAQFGDSAPDASADLDMDADADGEADGDGEEVKGDEDDAPAPVASSQGELVTEDGVMVSGVSYCAGAGARCG